jgi:uroporphyrinogen-III decarboxylase
MCLPYWFQTVLAGDKDVTPRQRVEAALHGEQVDQVPFTIYHNMLPRGSQERRLREMGLGLCVRTGVYTEHAPNVQIETRTLQEEGRTVTYERVRTPVGEVSAKRIHGGGYGTLVTVEHYIKRPEDYRVVTYWLRDTRYGPAYEDFRRITEEIGGDGYVMTHIGYSPLMQMLVHYLGLEQFSIDMAEHPDEFFGLYELLKERRRVLYEIMANSPSEIVLYCGNVHPEIMGRERFERYILPCYDEAADVLHAKGKMIGVHLDADNRVFAPAVARSKIDLVEAFTPPPDCDMSVADARRTWPDKTLWINFPSSVHLATPERIRQVTNGILDQAAGWRRFLIGVTEDIPQDVVLQSLTAIAETICRRQI